MKRIFTALAVVVVMMVAVGVVCFNLARPAPGKVDAAKIMAAAQGFAHELQAQGQAVPATVTLHDLMARGLLKPEDVSGFSGIEVIVSLTASGNRPQDVLMRVRMPDGSQMAALADGSVQSASK